MTTTRGPELASTSWPSTLYELTLAVADARQPEDVYEAALKAIEQSLGVVRSSVLVVDAGGVMRFRAWRGLSDAYRLAVDGHSPWTPDATDVGPILVEDVRADASLEDLWPVFEEENVRALAFVPLVLGRKVLGKFMLYYSEPHAFEPAEVLTAQTIAAHVAFALDQRAHRVTQQRYRSLTDALPALVATTTVEGEIEDVDESYRAYTGLTAEMARDWQTHQIIHPDDLDQATSRWAQALAAGEPLQNEMRLRRHDGVYRWHLMQAKPERDAAGGIERWVTISVDIEDRKRAQARDEYLAAATARLLAPIDSSDLLADIARLAVPVLADVCSIGVSSDAGLHLETAVADEALGPSMEAIRLRNWLRAPSSRETVGEAMSRGESVCVADTSLSWIEACAPTAEQVEAALTLRPRSLACFPLLSHGRPCGMIVFAVGVSGRTYGEQDFRVFSEVASRLSIALENRQLYENLRQAAADLQRANAAKDEFLGLVSHELKTPITMILGNAEVLQRRHDLLGDGDRQEALADIHTEAERLHRIIDNLLVLARLEQGTDIEREPILIRRVVQAVVRDHGRRFPHRVFEFDIAIPPTPVLASEQYVERAVQNLISNAEKYSPTHRPIVLAVRRMDGELVVRVLDEGPGIDEEEAEALFTPFYRSANAAVSARGMGIGLAVCKRVIEAQGGRIWAARRPEGGSEFAFALPIPADD